MRSLVAVVILAVGLWCGGAGSALAAEIALFEWHLNIEGALKGDADLPIPGVNAAGFDFLTGLGTITVSVSGAGAHYVGLFVDHEIDETLNGFSNEQSTAVGVPSAGLSYETDEPGFSFGDIFDNFSNSALDNTTLAGPEDMSMALAWSMLLGPGETATALFLVSQQAPPGGFYLQQFDPDSPDLDATLYFSTSLTITGGGQPGVPEPASLVLLATGLAGLAGLGLRARRSHRQ